MPSHTPVAAQPAAISVFGRMTAWAPEGALDLGAPRRRAVLALLLIDAGKVVSVSSIVGNIWGSEPPDSAITTVQSYVSRLRKLIADRPLRGGARLRLSHRSPGYVLDVAPDSVDVLRFEQSVGRGLDAQRRGRHLEAFDLLSQALRCWTAAPFLDLADYDFAAREAMRLDRLRLTALEECAAAAFALNRSAEVLIELEQEVVRHPMRERLVCQLMRAQYRNGRQADALHVFERTRRCLAEELGADVSPELERVHQEILRHGPSLAAQPAGVLTAPPRPPSPPADPVRPAERGREMLRLRAAMEAAYRGSGRTVLVTGQAGTGKTWLVRQFERSCHGSETEFITVSCPRGGEMPAYWPWAQILRRLANRNPGAVHALPTSTRSQLAALVPELNPNLFATFSPQPPQTGTFELNDALSQALLRLARRPVVLVLENFQWADPASLSSLGFLAQQTAESPVLIVVTARTFRVVDDPDWRAARAAILRSPNAEEIRLGALSLAETQRLISTWADTKVSPEGCAVLHARTGGNPYLLIELLESVRNGMTIGELRHLLPERMREVVMDTLSSLPVDVLAVLRACAVLGPGVRRDVVRDVAPGDDEPSTALRTAIRAGLLEVDENRPGTVDFATPVVGEVLCQDTPWSARVELHRRAVGSIVQRVSDPTTSAEAIVKHATALAAGPDNDLDTRTQRCPTCSSPAAG